MHAGCNSNARSEVEEIREAIKAEMDAEESEAEADTEAEAEDDDATQDA
jgi:hypothetical protein